jgi:hypothetical protein
MRATSRAVATLLFRGVCAVSLGVFATPAIAQASGAAIPPPPVKLDPNSVGLSGRPERTTQAKFDEGDPTRAYDPNTGQNLTWDCRRKTWIDVKTGEAVGFSGRRAADGSVIPPPPLKLDPTSVGLSGRPERTTQAQFDEGDPTRAYDPNTGQNLVWDAARQTWRDTRTGEDEGFQGRRSQAACPSAAGTTTNPPPPTPPLTDQGSAIPTTGPTQPLGGTAPPPEPTSPPPTGKFYVGVGGSYFFEPDTHFWLVSGTVGYRITPHVGVEVQGDVGVTKEKFDNGSTFKSSTGIAWSLYPTVVGYLPVGGNSDLFLHGGYGWTRFGSKATSFSGSSSTSFEDHNTVGTGILGGGADIGIGDHSSLRAEYDRLFFDNGSEGNRVSLSFVHTFGLRASELTGFPGPGGNAGAVPPPPPTPPPPAPPPPPPPE